MIENYIIIIEYVLNDHDNKNYKFVCYDIMIYPKEEVINLNEY